MKKIIEMSNTEAKNFFLKSSSYFNMALPEYFDFTNLLEDVDKKINNKTLSSLQKNKPENIPNINYEINHNKVFLFLFVFAVDIPCIAHEIECVYIDP